MDEQLFTSGLRLSQHADVTQLLQRPKNCDATYQAARPGAHPALFINVTDEQGTATRWTIEVAPTPYTLALRGWSKKRADDALKPGTAVSVTIHAARAGTPVGLLDSITNEEGVDVLGGGGAGPAR